MIKAQLKYLAAGVLLCPLLPVLAIQGKQVKKKVPMLPECLINREGAAGDASEEINIVALGESTFAGVGIEDNRNGVIGKLALYLSQSSGKKVNWRIFAQSGYSIKNICKMLLDQKALESADLILLGLGANDTFELNSPSGVYREVKQLISAIRAKTGCPILIAHVPPLGLFPAFPAFLKFVMGKLIQLNACSFRRISVESENVYFIDEEIEYDEWVDRLGGKYSMNDFFSDGIHPSPLTYDLWAKEIFRYISEVRLLQSK